MSTHTPGPWYIEEISNRDWQINSDSRDWCLLEITPAIYGESDSLSDEDKANARLIAAAPDLLEALKSLVKTLVDQDDEGMIEHAQQIINARSIIAKIEEQS